MSAPAQHPQIAPVIADAIPDELKRIPSWIVWKARPRPGSHKVDKIPVDPATGRAINPLDPANHLTFADAMSAYENGTGAGVGIVLDGQPVAHDGCGPLYLVGVDLDDVTRSPEAAAAAKAIWRKLGSYREISPSGMGVRIFAYSRHKPRSGQTKHGEMYAEKRFLTVTGHQARGTIVDATDAIRDLEARWRPTPAPTAPSWLADNVIPLELHRELMAETAKIAGDHFSETNANIGTIKQTLSHIPADLAYEDWRNIIWAIASLEWDCGRDLLLTWSKQSEAHWQDCGAEASAALHRIYNAYDPEAGIGIGTLYHHAYENGMPRQEQTSTESYTFDSDSGGDAEPSRAPNSRFRLLSRAALDNLPPMRWLIPGVLPETGLAAIYGPPGSGKTFLALDLAASISTGRGDWFGRAVAERSVVYVALEGGRGIRQRLMAWDRVNSTSADEIYVVLDRPALNDATAVKEFATTLKDTCPTGTVVIIDTLAQAMPGADENSAQDMGMALYAARHVAECVDGLVILVHHSGKDASRGMRGHSALEGAMDAVIGVERDKARGTHHWKIRKMKDAEDDAEAAFDLTSVQVETDEMGMPVTSCAVVPAQETSLFASTAEPTGKHQQAVIAALRADDGASQGWPDADLLTVAKAALHDVDTRYRATRAKAAVDALVEGGHLILHEGDYHLPP